MGGHVSYTLPALIFVPILATSQTGFSKKAVLLPTMILFSLSVGAISLAPNTETIIALRFLQGIGASAIATLNIALVPDLFSGRDRQLLAAGGRPAWFKALAVESSL